MARPPRIEYEGAVYHVTARGNERKKIYFSKTDYEQFFNYIAKTKKRYGILLHSYVLMSNHYHLILETPEANLSKAMHYINGSYTTYINYKKKRSGHLFQGRYKAIVVAKDNYLMELSRYIHLNPVRAGMVQKPEEYSYSSYKSYITNKKDKIVSQDLLLEMVSGRKGDVKRKYKVFVESSIGQDTDNPLKDVYGGVILGGKRFIKDTLKIIKEEYLQKEEISQRRVLQSVYETEEIINYVSGYFRIKKGEITENKYSEQRKIAVYLMKRWTGATNRQIGEVFGGISYSAVAKIYQRFKEEMKGNRKLDKRVSIIERDLSFVKG